MWKNHLSKHHPHAASLIHQIHTFILHTRTYTPTSEEPRPFYPKSTLPTLSTTLPMTNKRKGYDHRNGEGTLHSKRPRFNLPDSSDDLPSSSQPRLDPTYGQRGAFPGLDDLPDDHGLFYGPASDGLEYLRMVR